MTERRSSVPEPTLTSKDLSSFSVISLACARCRLSSIHLVLSLSHSEYANLSRSSTFSFWTNSILSSKSVCVVGGVTKGLSRTDPYVGLLLEDVGLSLLGMRFQLGVTLVWRPSTLSPCGPSPNGSLRPPAPCPCPLPRLTNLAWIVCTIFL